MASGLDENAFFSQCSGQPRDQLARIFVNMVSESQNRLALSDLSVECLKQQDRDLLDVLDAIDLVTLIDGKETKELRLSATSPGKWGSCEAIVASKDDHLLLFARSELLGDFGFFDVNLSALNQEAGGANEPTIRPEVESKGDGPSLKLAFNLPVQTTGTNMVSKAVSLLFEALFGTTGNVEDIDYAILFQGNLVNETSSEDDLPGHLQDLSRLYGLRFELTRETRDIDKAILSQRRAVDFTPQGHPEHPERLAVLAMAYYTRYESTSNISDIDKGVSLSKQAVALALPHQMAGLLSKLARSLESSWEATRRLGDLDEAISIHRKASIIPASADANVADQPEYLGSLARALFRRFRVTGQIDDLDESISTQRMALLILPEDHPQRHLPMCNLAAGLAARSKHLGQLTDLEESLFVLRSAISLVPERNRALPTIYNNLAACLQQYYERTRHISDLDEGIAALRKSIELTGFEDHPDMPARYNNLGIFLQIKFEATQDVKYAREGVSMQESAIRLTRDGTSELALRLMALSNSLDALAQQTGQVEDIDAAIQYGQRGTRIYPPGHSSLASGLYNLARCWSTRYRITDDIECLDQAIPLVREALALTDAGSAAIPLRLISLGRSLSARHERIPDEKSLDEARGCFEKAATSSVGAPRTLLQAARLWIDHADPPSSISAYDTAIRLISLIAGLEQTVERRHESLADMSSISLQAAAAALELGLADKALEWLEQGRCLVWRQLNNLRTPLDGLRLHDEALAERVLAVSRALETAGSRTSAVEPTNRGEALEHVKLAREWEELLETVRSIAGFEDFLRPPSSSTILQNLPEDGPVVIINVHQTRCDALALIAGCSDPIHIPLPKFSRDRAVELHRLLHDKLVLMGVRSNDQGVCGDAEDIDEDEINRSMKRLGIRRSGPDETIRMILQELWEDVVEPILEAIAIFPSAAPGRIWWCPTGPLTFLPIHAAGIYTPGNEITLADYAVPSYTPTVSSLLAHSKNLSTMENNGISLVATADSFEGLPALPGTFIEMANIEAQTESHMIRTLSLVGDKATADATVESMEHHSCIHFACHAQQNAGDPLKSGFQLHDRRLDLSTIIKSNLKHADLAFLSACQTSTGDNALSEEAVHLAAGMIAAGYRGVVATMWSIPDYFAPIVAREFYMDLLQRGHGDGRIDGSQAAYALRHSIQTLRAQSDTPVEFLAWVPYVHFGL